jgi:pyruvate dehydrogenase E2 component (dihydrolipoamide acetyltransferase)
MANITLMPKLSDTMTVGTLTKWFKKEGDVVKTGDMLAEVETDKATMELESYFNGTILKIFSAPGSSLPIGAPPSASPVKPTKCPRPPLHRRHRPPLRPPPFRLPRPRPLRS